ncbi:MAG: Bax inhibitor-1/YccA family protein [Synergistaceae bacterium]|jgi:FtsH-binding integral membrane protein|nr:Bax inhibitor-1/YccA family protein [Synergistaceae bacterium]
MDSNKDRVFDVDRVSARAGEISEGFMRKVYLWMTFGLAATGAVAYYVLNSESMMNMLFGNGMAVFITLAIAELGIVVYLSARVMKMNPSTASVLFFVYSALNGVTIAPLLSLYTNESVAQVFFISAGLFGGMSVYGFMTRRDLSSWGSFLMMGVFGIIIASVVNIFMRSYKANLVISIIAVMVFTGLTAYDTFKLRRLAAEGGFGDEVRDNLAVVGALSLYLDFINIFIRLLYIFGKRK